ncbi:hypothetical protein [Glycomyces sp. MUSA5-2]|uniref:hypothetical protein n=1 Tax=Glycomyces sp. MUSA5-2 TaxID=2053002 RepID=UPI00300A177B
MVEVRTAAEGELWVANLFRFDRADGPLIAVNARFRHVLGLDDGDRVGKAGRERLREASRRVLAREVARFAFTGAGAQSGYAGSEYTVFREAGRPFRYTVVLDSPRGLVLVCAFTGDPLAAPVWFAPALASPALEFEAREAVALLGTFRRDEVVFDVRRERFGVVNVRAYRGAASPVLVCRFYGPHSPPDWCGGLELSSWRPWIADRARERITWD